MARNKKKKKGKKTPGVFVDEISSGARPIEGVGTAIAAFVGFATATPFRLATSAVLVTAAVWAVARGRTSRRR